MKKQGEAGELIEIKYDSEAKRQFFEPRVPFAIALKIKFLKLNVSFCVGETKIRFDSFQTESATKDTFLYIN